MGLMRFQVHDRDRIPPGGLDHVHLCGQDDLPWFSRTYFSGDHLIIERNEEDSGKLFVPWRVDQSSPLLINTSTLSERERPYLLELELARGMLNNLRNQIAIWEGMGLVVGPQLSKGVLKATTEFSRAATTQEDQTTSADWAERSLASTVSTMTYLTEEYVRQATAQRRAQSRPTTTWFGVNLGSQPPTASVTQHVVNTFNMVSVPVGWRAIEAVEGRRNWTESDALFEWAKTTGMRLSAGPLLELDDRGVPDWTYLWEGDFESVTRFSLDQVTAVVERYRGRVHLWQVAARMTHGHVLGLDEGHRLQLVAKAIQTVRKLDPSTPVVVSFDQPWAEYMAHERLDLAPYHFADALVRADLGLAGVGLEINFGYDPGGSVYRGPLAMSRLVDMWSQLEVPLLVALTMPSSAQQDPRANPKAKVIAGDSSEITHETQREWIEQHLPLLMAKGAVQILLWNQLSDSLPHHYPHGGLFDAHEQPKPAMESLKTIRQQFFNGGR